MEKEKIEELVQLGFEFYDGSNGREKNAYKAFGLWLQAANLGYAKAQTLVAFCYEWGLGTRKDSYQAVEWYQKAAAQDDPKALLYLGTFYEYNGYGLEKNTQETIRLWRKAAELGLKEAQFTLGNCYWYGTYLEADKSEAIKWYRKSAQQLYSLAIERMNELNEWGFSEDELEKDSHKKKL